MKKLTVQLFTCLLFLGCANDGISDENKGSKGELNRISVSFTEDDISDKVTINWKNGDRIAMYPIIATAPGSPILFSLDGGNSKNATFSCDNDERLKMGTRYIPIHTANVDNLSIVEGKIVYTLPNPQTQNAKDDFSHIDKNLCFSGAGLVPDSNLPSTNVTLNNTMSIIKLKITSDIALSIESVTLTAAGKYFLSDARIDASGVMTGTPTNQLTLRISNPTANKGNNTELTELQLLALWNPSVTSVAESYQVSLSTSAGPIKLARGSVLWDKGRYYTLPIHLYKLGESVSDKDCYQVWMGLHCLPQNAATEPHKWARTAGLLQGINANLADLTPTEGTPSWGLKPCSRADYAKVISYVSEGKQAGMTEIPRSAIKSIYMPNRLTLEQYLPTVFTSAKNLGYKLQSIMFYDNRTKTPGYDVDPEFNWTLEEIQQMRDWLDQNGHSDIKMMFNARNNSGGVMAKCRHKAVEEVMLEASPGLWYTNLGNRVELLRDLISNPLTAKKRLYFQIPTHQDSPFGSPSSFQKIRGLMVWFGETFGNNFLKSDRIVILPVTYNNPTFTFLPELDGSNNYTNTLSSICLSLREQRELFAGYGRTPTKADADSYIRNNK